jgi:hypothetical protein
MITKEFYHRENFRKEDGEYSWRYVSPLNDELIQKAEKILGVKFPLAYIE